MSSTRAVDINIQAMSAAFIFLPPPQTDGVRREPLARTVRPRAHDPRRAASGRHSAVWGGCGERTRADGPHENVGDQAMSDGTVGVRGRGSDLNRAQSIPY